MKKRILSLIAASIMALSAGSLFGCQKRENSDDTPTGPNTPVTDNTDTAEPTDPSETDEPEDKRTATTAVPNASKVTVHYSNSEGWANVYAYAWNSATLGNNAAFPGVKLSSYGTSGLGEKQYKIDLDITKYDRVIFSDGVDGGAQTADLTVNAATSGFFGYNGTFTEGVGENDYGKVKYVTLSDEKNLAYTSAKKKKISVYTPRGYDPQKKYGVLYIFDGQNLYGAADGYKQETHGGSERWMADVAVNNLIKNGGDGLIIVGIDNSESSKQRDQELTQSLSFGTQTSLGGSQYGEFKDGKLDELGDFIKETVMPYVKANYSVDDSREKTGIAGSSSGGLGSYYLGLRDNDIYGYIGAFSPAYGIYDQSSWTKFYKNTKNSFKDGKKPKIYVYCGGGDFLEGMLRPSSKQIKSGLVANGYSASDITEVFRDDGNHSEVDWRIYFAEFLSKLAK